MSAALPPPPAYAIPAFLEPGGGAAPDLDFPEEPRLPPMPTVVDEAASLQLEPGSVKLLAWRLTVAVCIINSLCVFLAIGACASPWFSLVFDACTLMYGLSAVGAAPGSCADSGFPNYPASWTAVWAAVPDSQQASGTGSTAFVNTLGFAQFLMVCSFFTCLIASVSSGLFANAMLRGLPPHRLGTAYMSNAFTATTFTLSALATAIATNRLINDLNTAPRVYGPGLGAADTLVVFTCATMICASIAKFKLRAAANDSTMSSEKQMHAALLGSNPEGNILC